jgi:hypothetical protein
MRVGFWRKRQPAPEIGEDEAYERAYGRSSGDVKKIRLPPRRPRDADVLASGESMRRAFLDRLQQREDDEQKQR